MPIEKILSNEDCLKIENTELKLRLHNAQHQIMMLEAQDLINSIAQKYDAIGWQLELPNKRFVKPE